MDLSESTTPSTLINPALLGADNHNIGNTQGGSWFDPSSWGDKFENAGKFIAVSMLSGADSIYNSAATVGNWFGAGAELSDTQQWITSLDQDLGQYYSANRQSADLAGFIATSLIPGIGGVKILNAGQSALKAAKASGSLGSNLSRYTGLLAPSTENYIKLAATEIKSQQAAFSLINANTVKALGAGVYQNVLEAAAFETFVTATMFKSPVLSEQDNWDIAKNILVGGALGGVIGGAIEGAKTFSQLSKARVAEDIRLKPYSGREVVQEATSPADRILLATENRDRTPLPSAPTLPPNPTQAEQELYNAQLANSRAAAEKKFKQIDLDIRTNIHEMRVKAPVELGNMVADSMVGIDNPTAIKNFFGAIEITRPEISTALEKQAIKEGNPLFSRWVEIQGENAGRINSLKPAVLNVADTILIKGDQSLKDALLSEARSAGFKPSELWNPLEGKLSVREAQLRTIWAREVANLKPDALVHGNDIPLLEAYLDKGILPQISMNGVLVKPLDLADLKDMILKQKDILAPELLATKLTGQNPDLQTAAIAKVLNVKESYLEGTRNAANPSADLFAHQSLTEINQANRIAKGLASPNSEAIPSYFEPSVAKINYRYPENIDPNMPNFAPDAMVAVKIRQLEFQQAANNVVAKQAGTQIDARLADIDKEKLFTANTVGAGNSFLKSAQGKYGSLESTVQQLGGVSKDLRDSIRREVNDALEQPLYHLRNNREAAIEASTINQQLSRTTEQYVFDRENLLGLGENTLIPKKFADALKGNAEATTDDLAAIRLQEGAPEYIKINNWETVQFFEAHQQLTAKWAGNAQERAAAYGKLNTIYPADVVRPYRHSTKDFPYFAFVKDPRVTGSGHTTMLFANSEKELNALIAKTNRDFPEFEVLTKRDTAEWFEAHQEYEYSRGLNQNYIDSSLKSKGIYSNFYTETDPNKIADTLLQYHYRNADVDAAEIVRLRYNAEFDWLENQAQSYSRLEASKFGGGKFETIQQNEKNPYISYIRTALNLSSTPTSNPWWSLNKYLDDNVSKFVGRVRNTFDSASSPSDLDEVNKLLNKYGSQTAFNSAAEEALINHTAPKAELSKFVRSANAILSRFTLGLDPLNAINNAIGSNVLRGTEINQLTRAIREGNSEIAGELAGLSTKIPGVDSTILTPSKLIGNSIKRFFANPELREEYKQLGFIKDRLDQFAMMADDLTLRGTETAKELSDRIGSAFSRAKKLADAGEKYTGNVIAEEFNRFLSADAMRQITDIAQKAGILNQAESLAYINTFVNRVEGTILASQRPGLFQGPLGQAIGLFQSYQFNLMQQLFRYVADGSKKDIAMLLGLQGTFYGLQGEPGFKFINDHIVGTMSGNKEHRDIYDATRGIAGREAGDWLLYGVASNIMQTNIYSRGDINPRSLTIVPTTLSEVPFVGGMDRVFSSLYEAAKKIGNGADVWETMRQAIEHNGISRPLAGLAQVSRGITGDQVFSTSSKSTIIGSNDLLSLASLSRIAGGRPLDEAIQNDTMYSIRAYEAVDRKRKDLLAESVKTSVIGHNNPEASDVAMFAANYAALGGKQGSFNQYFMDQYMKANTSQAQILYQKLSHPMSYKIQALMGGQEN